jgi:TP901 family phage tail tape measure protein
MTIPTLALGVSASGADEVARLAASVSSLKNNLKELASVSTGGTIGNLEALTKEFREMRQELNATLQGLRTDLAANFQKAFDAAAKQARAGGDQVEGEMKKAAAKVRVAAKSIDLGGTIAASVSGSGLATKDAVAKLAAEIAKMPAALKAAGDKSIAEQVTFETKQKALWVEHLSALQARLSEERLMMNEAVERFRAIRAEELASQVEFENRQKARWVQHQDDLAKRMSRERFMMADATAQFRAIRAEQLADQVQFESKQKDLWRDHQAALKIRLEAEAHMMEGAVAQFREVQADKLAAQIAFEDKEKARWVAHMETLRARLAAERSMMDQAARQFRDIQANTFARTVRGSVGQTMSTPARGLDPTSAMAAGTFSSIAEGSYGALRNIPKELDNISAKAPKARAELHSLSAAMNDGHSAARGLASGFNAMFLTWGNIAPLLAGAALSNGFVQTIKMGSEVQQNLSIIGALSQETSGNVAQLNAQMLEMARSGPFGPKEISAAMKTLSLAGLEAAEVASSVKDVLNFAVAGATSIEKAADVMTSVATAFRVSAEGYNYVGDVIAKTAAVSKASVESIGEAFKTASVVNSQYGVSLEDVGTGLALLSNVSIQGTAAGTALRNMYVDILGRTPKVRSAIKELTGDSEAFFDKATGKSKDLISVFQIIEQNIGKFNKIGQTRVLQDIFSERGGKEAIEVLDAIRRKADETGQSVESVLEKMRREIAASAGFMASAAAQMSLTPLNQMKSVVSTLQATLVETFDSLTPYIMSTSERLKELFNSQDFKTGLRNLMVGMAELTSAFARNLDVVATLLAAWVGFKVVSGISSMVGALSDSVARYSIAANLATKETQSLTLAQIAQREATLAGAGATAAKAASLSGLLAVGARFLPWVGMAIAAWEMYSFWTDKSKQSNETFVGDSHAALISALRNERDRLHEINEAKAQGISLDELKRNKQVRLAANDLEQPVREAQAKLDTLRAQRAKMRPSSAPATQFAIQFQDEQIAKAERELEAQRTLVGSRKREQLRELDRLQIEATAIKESELAAAKKRADEIRAGAQQYALGGGKDKGDGGKHVTKQSLRDNDLATLDALMRSRESVLRNAYTNEQQLLDAKHRGDLISEGTYQAEVLKRTEQFEADNRKLILQTMLMEKREFEDRQARLKRDVKDPKELQQQLKNLENDFNRYGQNAQAALDKVTNDSMHRQRMAAVSLETETRKLSQANADYWMKADATLQKETQLAAVRQQNVFLSEEERVALEARVRVTENHSLHLEKLAQDYTKATSELQDFTVAMGTDDWSVEAIAHFLALSSNVDALAAALENSKQKLREFQDQASRNAVLEFQNRKADEFARSLSDALSDAILNGGKEGGKKLKDWLKDFFIKEPLTVFIRSIVQPFAPAMSQFMSGGFGGNLGGLAGGGSITNGGSSMMNNLGLIGAGIQAFTGASVGASAASLGVANAAGMLGGDALGTLIAANGGWAGVSAGAGMSAAGAAGAAGAGAAGIMGTIGTALPWVGAALLAAQAFGLFDRGGPKTESGFGPGVTLRGDSSSAKAMSDAVEALYKDTAGSFAKPFEVGVFTATDPQGDARTQLEVEAFLSDRNVYSRKDRLGGQNKIENVGRSEAELAAAIAEETNRAVLRALQESDLPNVIGAFLRDLGDINAMAASELEKSLARIKKSLAERQTLEERFFQLTATDLEKVTKARKAERDALDEMNRALYDQIVALEDMISVREREKAVLEKSKEDLLSAYERDKEAADTAAQAADDARQALEDVYTVLSDGLLENIQLHRDYASTLRETARAMDRRADSPNAPAVRTGLAKATFEMAVQRAGAGDKNAIESLPQYSQDYIDSLQSSSSSSAEFRLEFARVQGALRGVAIKEDATADVAQLQLDALNRQLAAVGILTEVVNASTGEITFALSSNLTTAADRLSALIQASDGNVMGVMASVGSSTVNQLLTNVQLTAQTNAYAQAQLTTETAILQSLGLLGGAEIGFGQAHSNFLAAQLSVAQAQANIEAQQLSIQQGILAALAPAATPAPPPAPPVTSPVPVTPTTYKWNNDLSLEGNILAMQALGFTYSVESGGPGGGFATGGVFSNSIIKRPTLFDPAQMGEAGPEAILPLVNIGGQFGVRSTSSGANDALLLALIAEVKQLRAEAQATARFSYAMQKNLLELKNRGIYVRNNPDGEVLQTTAV